VAFSLGSTFSLDCRRRYFLKFGVAEVDAHAFWRGHRGDDTLIYFPDLKVVMVSDQMTDANPGADYANGGSLFEWNRSLDGVLRGSRLEAESESPRTISMTNSPGKASL
jgi:hypothetical protein